jgi:trehalose-6-phosphate synthase
LRHRGVGRFGAGRPLWRSVLDADTICQSFHSRTALARIYRSADVALVRPLRDGMSLVAKEYVAAQDAVNPGVLILSQFAGAAAELTGALTLIRTSATRWRRR